MPDDGTDEGDEGDEGDPDDPPDDDPPDDEPPDDPPLAAMGTTITTMSRLIPTAPPAASYHVGRASSFATHSGRELLAAFASVRALPLVEDVGETLLAFMTRSS